MNEVQKRLNDFISYLGMSVSQFEQSIGVGNAFVKNTNERMRNSSKNLIATRYPELNMDWLMKGRGEMLKPISNTLNSYGNNSANTINGNATIISTSQKGCKTPVLKDIDTEGAISKKNDALNNINVVDLFKEATSAIRNNDNSMQEYPLGAIIILKRLTDKNNIVWGDNYYIETVDYHMIRRIQECDDEHIVACSSNEKTNQDGMLIYSPIKIAKDSIISISAILGYVKKENDNNLI